jgi:DNA repair protein SbcD/Mre11
MKILHTADWHIGKKLHKHDLARDFDLFIKWLGNTIEKEEVDVLLVSGDVFDLANPSSEARRQYYRALMELRKFNCKIILTGGNHDSPAMLDAPAEILRELDMHVIGGLPENLEEVIIPVKNENGETEIVIAALPYLRDSDLRSAGDGHTYEDRLEALRKGIQLTFSRAAEICNSNFPGCRPLLWATCLRQGQKHLRVNGIFKLGTRPPLTRFSSGIILIISPWATSINPKK